jgi:hypothetical protein
MVGLPQTDVWQLFLGAIISSGVVVVIIETIREWRFKKDKEFVERTKLKVEIISKAAPYYNQLSMYAWGFAWNVTCEKVEQRNHERIMYYMCKMLYFREEIIKKFGDLQFDSLDAEQIIYGFWTEIKSTIEEEFGYVDTSKLVCMVEGDTPYHKFQESLSNENKKLYDKFLNWISKMPTGQLEKGMWYSQLIQLELNHIYALWYGREPSTKMREGLKTYLLLNHPKYYNRILDFHRGFFRARHSIMIES